ncbi:MAG: DinB family protein [Chloroflexota bacterium]
MEQFFVDYLDLLHALSRDFIATFDDLPAEALDWVPGVEMNSFGILVVHTTGAARYFLSDVVMSESSNRNRALEFQTKGLSRAELKARFESLESYARGIAERLTLADLATSRPITLRDGTVKQMSNAYALLHALDHTGLHLGHAQITRQLWQTR